MTFEIKCRGVQVPTNTKPKDALLRNVALAAKRQEDIMSQARSKGWEMKRQARIAIERKKRALEKQAEKESSNARKDLALQEKSDRIAEKAGRMQKFEAERRLAGYAQASKLAQKERTLEELSEKKEIMENRIKEKELLASRMGWDCIDLSDQGLVEVPEKIYWFRQEKKSKDEESKNLSTVLLFDLSHNRLAQMPSNSFWFRADKLQVVALDYNQFEELPSGLSDCRDILSFTMSQNRLQGPTVLGAKTPLNALHNLISLDLSANFIQKWPAKDGFKNIFTLEVLKLGNNQLEVIPGPECLSTLIALKHLDISTNHIHALGSDNGIGSLTCLQTLNLSGNVLESLPEDLGLIGSTLLSLNLSNNNLRWLPTTLGSLSGLRLLNVSRNQLTTLPTNIRGLKALVEINGGRNLLGIIPETFGELINLEIINFQHNNLRALPETVGLLTRLQHVDLHNNKLVDLPREMGSWVLLRQLDVQSNKIKTLPSSCGHCHRLVSLNIGFNQIEMIPHTVSTLTELEFLNFSSNNLMSLTPGIGKATRLVDLDLGGNVNLHTLPRTIGDLGKLKRLNISSCGMSKLPNDLVRCTALQSLWLRHNRLEALPIELVEQVPTLHEFDVTGNPLRKLPERWSGLKRSHVSGTGYTSRDASEYIARQSRVHPMAVRVWERMMKEKAPGWRPPETPAEVEMPHVKGVTSNVVSEMNTEAGAMALWNDQEGKEERENRVEGKDRQDDREKDEFTDLKHLNQFTSSHDTTPPIVVVSGGARKSDGSSVYKLPITLTEFMKELKDDLGVRWDEHARETSIRFFKQARNLFGRAPRYDQLDLNDFEEEKYARKMAARRIEDKVVWSHRDNIRAEEFRQQAYESSLDSLGLKILNRRMRRDYAERQRLQKTKEAHELNEKMRNEMIKQEERAEKLRREREEKRVREKEVLRQQVLERLNKYPVKEKKNRLVGYVVSLNDVEEVDSLEMLGGTGSSHVEEGRGERRWGGAEGE